MRPVNVLRIAGTLIVAGALAGTAHAQLFRAYLASNGNDANPCTLPSPCRLLPAALTAVADGGEIWMLDSANYNTATVDITKSVNIIAVPGAQGSVVATGGPAINIATAGVKVSLRNLVIAPLAGAGGTGGVVMTDGAALTVAKCLIANLPEVGIDVNAAARVLVTDTTIRDNGFEGLLLRNGANSIVARATIIGNTLLGGEGGVVVRSEITITTTADIAYSTIGANIGASTAGVLAESNNPSGVVSVSVSDSQLVQNNSNLIAVSNFGGAVTLSASNNIVTQGEIGIAAVGAGTRVWASGNTVGANDNTGILFYNDDGNSSFESAGNNSVDNSNAGNVGTISTIATL